MNPSNVMLIKKKLRFNTYVTDNRAFFKEIAVSNNICQILLLNTSYHKIREENGGVGSAAPR